MTAADDIPWHENDKLFREQQNIGRKYEAYVAAKLVAEGLGVRVPVQRTRPTFAERAEYRDSRDILVDCPNGFVAEIEVKSLRHRFTGADDFPYSRIFLDGQKLLDKKGAPTAYVHISQLTNGMFVTPKTSAPHWRLTTRTDSIRGITNKVYSCAMKHQRSFADLIEYLKEQR